MAKGLNSSEHLPSIPNYDNNNNIIIIKSLFIEDNILS